MTRRTLVAALAVAVVCGFATSAAGQPGAVVNDRVRPGLGFTPVAMSPSALHPRGICSFAFLFRGSDGREYASTAGHCAGIGPQDDALWRPGEGPEVMDDRGRSAGRFVYARRDEARGGDFGLVLLPRGTRGNPQMCRWGGPTRMLTEERDGVVYLRHYGQGLLFGTVAPDRRAVAHAGLAREVEIKVSAATAPADSGSALSTADGAAVGVLVNFGIRSASRGLAGAGATRLDLAVAEASRVTGVR